jgi:chromosome segregation ATPase
MWGLTAIAVPALLVAVVIGLGLHAWQLATERDRLAEELARPRPEDPELAAAREKVRRLQQDLDAANRTIAELRAAAPPDSNLPACSASLLEARTKLGTAESRVATLEASLRTSQTQLTAAAKSNSDLEVKHAEERARLQTDLTGLQSKNTELGGEIAKRDRLLRTLCAELRAARSNKVLQLCQGVK